MPPKFESVMKCLNIVKIRISLKQKPLTCAQGGEEEEEEEEEDNENSLKSEERA